MGAFYANITVATNDTDAVVETIKSLERDAYVAPGDNGFTMVYDSEEMSERDTILLLETLTKRFNCGAIAVCIADDDVMFYLLADRGRILEEYNSNPDYQDAGEDPPSGGDVDLLIRTFGGKGDPAYIRQVLHEYKPMFETDRHMRLIDALGLPRIAAGLGHTYIYQGEAPPELKSRLIGVGDAPLH